MRVATGQATGYRAATETTKTGIYQGRLVTTMNRRKRKFCRSAKPVKICLPAEILCFAGSSVLWYARWLSWATGMVPQKGLFLTVMLALAWLDVQPARLWALPLPYDNTCPVIYDNDDADDMYTDEYLLSLASAGNITLKGMITTSGGWSQPLFPDPVFNFQWDLSGRSEIVSKALRSGMSNLPTPVAGSSVALVQPGSGVIEDTTPINTPGAQLIITEAHNATVNHPLVVIMGCPPTRGWLTVAL